MDKKIKIAYLMIFGSSKITIATTKEYMDVFDFLSTYDYEYSAGFWFGNTDG